MANRQQRARVAAETVAILERGDYEVDGRRVDLGAALSACRRGTLLYTPHDSSKVLDEFSLESPETGVARASIRVANCTTFAAARQLIAEGFDEPLCLNFASAKNPGGGFLSGSQAQEESLARASGLYASLLLQPSYYEANRRCPTCLYTDHAIYSPKAPVFRDDEDRLLSSPYVVSFVTAPAVNAGAVRKNEPDNVARIEPAMRRRIDSVLAIARKHNHRAVVLGAWGCGVFRNDPAEIACWFRDALTGQGHFARAFDRVFFAVLDSAEGTPTFNAFRNTLSESLLNDDLPRKIDEE